MLLSRALLMRVLVQFAFATIALVTVGCAVSAQSVGSPTGREPQLIWTPERQATLMRMKADYEANPNSDDVAVAWFRLIKENAECACKYGDTGLWATLMFQATGDQKYVSLAWTQINKWFFSRAGSAVGGNFAREYSAELVLLYDWLYPGLRREQRAFFLARLNDMFSVVLTNPSNPMMPVNPADSDQTVGMYFGLAFLYLATSGHNPAAAEFFNRSFVGGLSPTARDRATLRNAIADYVAMAEGGEWIESSEYNLGTTRLMLMGAAGVKTATRIDYFPEVTRWAWQAAIRPIYVITPDLRNSYQWGDEENPGPILSRLFTWQTTNAMLAGLPAVTAAFAQDFTQALVDEYGVAGYQSGEPWARAFLFFNPYAAPLPRSHMPLGWFSQGQGLLTYRTQWAPEASMFGAHMLPQQAYVHHQVQFFGDFQIYRKGGWAISHPFSYNGLTVTSGEGVNAMTHGGFGLPAEFRGAIGAHFGPAGTYAYLAGTVGGQVLQQNSYNPPPTFIHEWSRSLLYLSSTDKSSDTVVVFDRTHAENPAALPGFDRYTAAQQQLIVGGPVKRWFLHMPVEPRFAGTSFQWSISSDQVGRLTSLLPAVRDTRIVNEGEAWNDPNVDIRQRKWHVRISPAVEQRWDTFLNVVQVHDVGAVLTSELVESTNKDVQGVIVRRQGQSDVVTLFNAVPGPKLPALVGRNQWDPAVQSILARVRFRTGGFFVGWNSRAAASQVFLCDLAPDLAWSVSVDGKPSVRLRVHGSGLAGIVVKGSGNHTIVVQRDAPGIASGELRR